MVSELKKVSPGHLFIAELAPAEVGLKEVHDYLGLGLTITVNTTSADELERLTSIFGSRIECCRIPRHEGAILEYLSAHGGCTALKLRQNFPITNRLISDLASTRADHQRLRIIAQSGSGVSHIDLAAAAHYQVLVTYTPGCNAQAVAEHVLRSMLTLASRAHYHAGATARGIWTKEQHGLGTQIAGKTLGLVGMGASAISTARLAKAFGMKVQGFGGSRFDDQMAASLKVTRSPSLEALLTSSDFISLHVPLTPSTRHLIGAQEIQLMRRGAMLINTSRGEVVDEESIAVDLACGEQGRLGGVALDVFRFEGKDFGSPLLGLPHPNVLLTPHIAGSTVEALAAATTKLQKQVAQILAGEIEGVCLARLRETAP